MDRPDLMIDDQYRQDLCLRLASAETESDVEAVLTGNPAFAEPANWLPYGGRENNEGIIGNQQSDAVGALVEKLVNSLDAVLMKECLLGGIDPRGSEAPRSMQEAAEFFFGVPGGDLRRLTQKKRGELAQNIYLVASGERASPSIAVVDQGEGQCPERFARTFLDLLGDQKRKIPFVQGKYHMGGSGALFYCGRRKYQLIVSRRHPELSDGPSRWGFTLVRLGRTADRTWSYQYFAPEGQIASFEADSVPLLPAESNPRGNPLGSGTYIKMYEFNLSQKSMVQTHLFRILNLRLFTVPIPLIVYEARDYESEGPWAVLSGMRFRLDGSQAVTDGFPIHWADVKLAEGNYVQVAAWLLKEDVDLSRQEWLRPDSAVCLTINGQTHTRLPKRFYDYGMINKDYLKNHLLVEVDCSNLDPDFSRQIFMPSRDKVRETDEYQALESELRRLLKEDERLRQENERRYQSRRARPVEESEEYRKMVAKLVAESPELARLLGGTGRLSNPHQRSLRGDPEPFRGERFPTHLTLRTPQTGKLELPSNRYRRIVLETDAQNDYLTRAHEPGHLTVTPENWVRTKTLRDGYLTVLVEPPAQATMGDKTELEVRLTSPKVPDDFTARVTLTVVAPEPVRVNPHGKSQRRKPKVALPAIDPVYRHDWPQGWDEKTVAEVSYRDAGSTCKGSWATGALGVERKLRSRPSSWPWASSL